jgi:glycosyltransferase involved in cell wall biosynthesis
MFRDYLIGRIARAGKLPYVVQLRGNLDISLNTGPLGRMRLMAYRGLFKRSATVLTLNTPTRNAVVTLEPEVADRCEIIPNFISADDIRQKPPSTEVGTGGLKIVFAGSLIPTKGMSVLLDIVRRVDRVHLTLIGAAATEHDEQYLENFRDPGVSDRVTLAGSLPNEEVLRILAESDVYCLPSHTEGFPISVLEAMFVGLPVVASTVGAIPDMIDVPRGGVLCSPGDTDNFVAAIEKMRDSPEERRHMGQHNRDKALDNYDYGSVSHRLAELYQSIAGTR